MVRVQLSNVAAARLQDWAYDENNNTQSASNRNALIKSIPIERARQKFRNNRMAERRASVQIQRGSARKSSFKMASDRRVSPKTNTVKETGDALFKKPSPPKVISVNRGNGHFRQGTYV